MTGLLGEAEAFLRNGDCEGARKKISAALEPAAREGRRDDVCRAHILRIRVELADGHPDRAEIYLEKAVALSRELKNRELFAQAHLAGAEYALLVLGPQDAGEYLQSLEGVADSLDRTLLYVLQAEAAWQSGNPEEARTLAQSALDSKDEEVRARALGVLGHATGDPRHFEEATTIYRTAAARLDPEHAERYLDHPVRAEIVRRAGLSGAAESRRLAAVVEALRRMNAEDDLRRMLTLLVDSLLDLVDGWRGLATVVGGEEPAVEVGRHRLRRGLTEEELTFTRQVAKMAVEGGKIVTSGDVRGSGRFASVSGVQAQDIGGVLCLPLATRRRRLGALYVDHRGSGKGFDPADVELAKLLADPAAVAIERSLQFSRTERDALTGLGNAAHFEKILETEFARARRFSKPLSILLLNLDHFKLAGERYGYDAANAFLRAAADLVGSTVREAVPDAVVCRGGTDAFLVLLPGAGKSRLAEIGRRIVERFRTHTFLSPAGEIGVTMSAGGAALPDDVSGAKEWFLKADEALYRAKEEGRDRFCLSGEKSTTRRMSFDEEVDSLLVSRRGRAVLGMVSKIVREGGELDAMLTSTLERMSAAVGATRGFVLLDGKVRASFGIREEDADISRGVFRRVSAGETVMIEEVAEDAWASERESIRSKGVRSILAAPIARNGAVYLDSTANRFREEDRALLEAFARLIAPPIEQAAKSQRLQRRVEDLERELGERSRYGEIVGKSAAMREVYSLLDKIAATDYPVVIEGETGTGKELVARAIHVQSKRKSKPFVAINCGAVTESLLESELFGHLKGAFTGADRDRKGLFEAAEGGTLFLDEIEEMDAAMQKKLLRTLEEGTLRPVGARADVKVDVRVIAATNRALRDLVKRGEFREDLYYRLKTFPITLPPLRERAEDLPLLVDHFLEQIARETGTRKKISEAAVRMLARYSWPGNIRELRNELRRMCVVGGEALDTGDVPDSVKEGGRLAGELLVPGSYQEKMEAFERQLLERALEQQGGKIRPAARALGIDRNTLKAKIKKYGLRGEEERG